MEKEFWKDWWKMIKKTHNINLENVGWLVSFLLFITTIMGIISKSGQVLTFTIQARH
jgi:hypothetical protein